MSFGKLYYLYGGLLAGALAGRLPRFSVDEYRKRGAQPALELKVSDVTNTKVGKEYLKSS